MMIDSLKQLCPPSLRTIFMSLFASTALLSILISSPDQAVAQAPRAAIEEEIRYRVELGSSIAVSVSAESADEIVAIKAYYRPHGDNTISSYNYPDFKAGKSIDATFEIDVRSPSYYPPGTMFDLNFEFTTSDGSVVESDSYVVENLDADRQWQRVGGDDLELIYYGINQNAITHLYSETSSRLPRIKSALGISETPTLRAVIFPNFRDLARYGPMISEAATDGTFFGGFAYAQYNLTIMASPSVSILTHELTHLIYDKAFSSPLSGRSPVWLNEGIASYFETGSRAQPRATFAPHLRAGEIMSFRKMNSVPGRRRDIGVFYAQSADFVAFLAERYGEQELGRLIHRLNEGDQIDEAMLFVYGSDLTALENDWRSSYGLPPVPNPEPTVAFNFDELPPTIPGLPTYATETDSAVAKATPRPTALPHTQVAVTTAPTPEPTVIQATPTPGGYFTGSEGEEWPTPNPTMLIVFALLGLGVFAMLWRRTRT